MDEGRLHIDTSLFYMIRHNEQLLTGEQMDPSNPDTFIFYTGNAKSGYNYGLESTLAWRRARELEFGGTLGLLQTQYQGFVQNGVEFPTARCPTRRLGRPRSMRPGANPAAPMRGWIVTGMGAFFYDLPPNDTRSNAYGLVNGKLGWEHRTLRGVSVGTQLAQQELHGARLLFRRRTAGFHNKLYTQLGEPRNFGVHFTARY